MYIFGNIFTMLGLLTTLCFYVFAFNEIKRLANEKDDTTKKDMSNNELYRKILVLFMIFAIVRGFK